VSMGIKHGLFDHCFHYRCVAWEPSIRSHRITP